MSDGFFEQVDDGRFDSHEHTRGPWSPDHQHAGPPAALLGGALQQALDGRFLARLTFEILRPIPIAALTVSTQILRGGRKVALAEGALADDDGPVMMVRGWAIRTEQIPLPQQVQPGAQTVTSPEDAAERAFFGVPWDVGYHTAMDVRFVHGAFTEPGPAFAWMRPKVDIVAGQPVTPLQRVLVGADSGNGLSSALPPKQWLFINTDLTVHLHREPAGQWVGFDAASTLEPHGVGLATTAISDQQGPLGRGLQSLLVAPQP